MYGEDNLPKQRKIVDYDIVNFFTIHYNPYNKIKELLEKGYQPYGYLLLDNTNCIQAMVKYED